MQGKQRVLGFWSHKPSIVVKQTGSKNHYCFSNWSSSKFELDGKKYISTEQRMMEQKALLFGDNVVAAKIMAVTFEGHPETEAQWDEWTKKHRLIKNLGREVDNFDQEKWSAVCEKIVYDAIFQKFSQNESIKKTLLETKDAILAEASPHDKVWGIGLAPDNPKVQNRDLWEGQNLLGECLMKVRAALSEEAKL